MAANFGRIRTLLREGAALMTSAPVRDPVADHLLTPQNTALLLIDYQPSRLAGVHSMDRDLLLKNAVSTVRTIKKRYGEQEPWPVRPKRDFKTRTAGDRRS
jgi:hypothetical protein